MAAEENNQATSIPDDISYKPGTFRYQNYTSKQRKRLFDERQIELNPCHKESEIANECLLSAGENIQQCYSETENYKTCKRFWNAVRLFATANHLVKNDGFPPLSQRPIWKKQIGTWVETKKLQVPDEIKPLI